MENKVFPSKSFTFRSSNNEQSKNKTKINKMLNICQKMYKLKFKVAKRKKCVSSFHRKIPKINSNRKKNVSFSLSCNFIHCFRFARSTSFPFLTKKKTKKMQVYQSVTFRLTSFILNLFQSH